MSKVRRRCVDCRKIRITGLPSDFDPDWLGRNRPSVDWRCEPCYTARSAEMDGKTVEITEARRYLIKLNQVVPLLGSIAGIVMVCLEIAWHT